ncbi:MAG: hypothetical protein M1839_008973 [Geoglossum umbratile]|nr:MAG: hypothetical protein M1839_008973 [Geoglossum umbratile]
MAGCNAFFYGTLMAPRVLYRICYGNPDPEHWQANLLTIVPAILHNFRRHKVRYADYPAILPQANGSVRGTLVTGLTPMDVSRLDRFEGSDYARKKVKVRTLVKAGDGPEDIIEGEEVETEVYVWISGMDELEDGEWDFAEFITEKVARWAEAKGKGTCPIFTGLRRRMSKFVRELEADEY